MARKVKDADLDTRTARQRLAIQGKPHWKRIEEGLHIGFRRLRGRSGTWTARHYDEDGYSFDVIGSADDNSDADGLTVFTFDQAVAKARDLHLARAKKAAGIHGELTVDQAIDEYGTHLSNNGKSTYALELNARKYISPLIGDLEVASLTTEVLNKWRADVAAMPARGSRKHDPIARKATSNQILRMLKAALNVAFKAGKVPSDQAWKRVVRYQGVIRKREQFLSVAESKRLINACDQEFRPLVQAALQTGCRYMELARLLVSDFDTDSKTLSVRHSKSGKPRKIFLTAEGVALFESLAAGRRRSDPLIRRADGLPWDTSQQIRRMKLTRERAGLDGICFHSLRHSYASELVRRGVPLVYVAKSLGHRDTTMVEQHYGHLAESDLSEAIRAAVPSYGLGKSNVKAFKRS